MYLKPMRVRRTASHIPLTDSLNPICESSRTNIAVKLTASPNRLIQQLIRDSTCHIDNLTTPSLLQPNGQRVFGINQNIGNQQGSPTRRSHPKWSSFLDLRDGVCISLSMPLTPPFSEGSSRREFQQPGNWN